MRISIWCIMLAITIGIFDNIALASGPDMWNGEMQKSLYEPHKNNCDGASEAFIPMGRNGIGGAYGYCIEKSQRTASYYDNARQTCASLGKRLPEPVEFVFACVNYGGSLNNITDDWEWVGNYITSQSPGSQGMQGFSATVAGSGGCRKGAMGVVGDYALSAQSFTFRCVY